METIAGASERSRSWLKVTRVACRERSLGPSFHTAPTHSPSGPRRPSDVVFPRLFCAVCDMRYRSHLPGSFWQLCKSVTGPRANQNGNDSIQMGSKQTLDRAYRWLGMDWEIACYARQVIVGDRRLEPVFYSLFWFLRRNENARARARACVCSRYCVVSCVAKRGHIIHGHIE